MLALHSPQIMQSDPHSLIRHRHSLQMLMYDRRTHAAGAAGHALLPDLRGTCTAHDGLEAREVDGRRAVRAAPVRRFLRRGPRNPA